MMFVTVEDVNALKQTISDVFASAPSRYRKQPFLSSGTKKRERREARMKLLLIPPLMSTDFKRQDLGGVWGGDHLFPDFSKNSLSSFSTTTPTRQHTKHER
jgi:hypothetical protein